MRSLELLLDGCDRVIPLLRAPTPQWSAPSALAGWTVGGLAGHLARSAFNMERALDHPAPVDATVVDAIGYYTAAARHDADSAIGRRIRALGDLEAANGPDELVTRFVGSVERLRKWRLPDTPIMLFTTAVTVDACATACLLELVVHADDLAVSVGAPAPDFDPATLDLVLTTLTGISAYRHGAMNVIRSLARPARIADVSAF